MDTGILILRLVVGGLVMAHGAQKAFGAFGGLGPAGTAPLFEAWGLRPGRTMVLLAASVELVGSGLLLLGLLTPLGAAMVLGTLTVAASVNAGNGLWAVKGGFELPLTYAVAAAVLGFTGSGRYGIDQALGLDLTGEDAGLAALAAGLIAAGAFIALARRNLGRATTPTTAPGGTR